jgi:hypothetical protein
MLSTRSLIHACAGGRREATFSVPKQLGLITAVPLLLVHQGGNLEAHLGGGLVVIRTFVMLLVLDRLMRRLSF